VPPFPIGAPGLVQLVGELLMLSLNSGTRGHHDTHCCIRAASVVLERRPPASQTK
jgi:hypothetical protein